MRKYLCAALVAVAGHVLPASSQTLLTIDGEPVSTSTFLTAYNRNGTGLNDKTPGIKEYLDLFIASRLKIREARKRGLDTVPQMLADIRGLREQILPSYLEDRSAVDSLVKEAFTRSQWDIELYHIFISAQKDSVAARAKAVAAHAALRGGASFASVAQQYSDDPSAAKNEGSAGFITAFSLPYLVENIIYNTPVGKVAPVYRSASGYHIFKNGGKRKAAGRVRAAQILFAFPPGADAVVRSAAKRGADSVYALLQGNADFGTLATKLSNDVISAASNGQLPEFGVGDYDPLFEKTIYNLPKNGVVSRPFETAYGWHIVKRLSFVTPAATLDNSTAATLREKVLQSDRMQKTKEALLKKIYAEAPLSPLTVSADSIWRATDRLLQNAPGVATAQDWTLMRIGKEEITFGDWLDYTRDNRGASSAAPKPYPQLFWEGFVPLVAMEYYKAYLEDFNASFREQVEGFRDGNLFFEIMQQQIWGPAQTDTAALRAYYNQYAKKYVWKSSADAVIFYAGDASTATALRKEIVRSPAGWRSQVAAVGEKVVADSNRFEFDVIPNGEKIAMRTGLVTTPVLNKADKTVSWALILRVYPKEEQRSFDAAKGLVIADYGESLDRAWIAELKKKYPVQVNEAAWNALLKKSL